MVFLIQKSQNKDSKAIHLKLNELLASHQGASNRMVDIEDLTEKELDHLHKFYVQLSDWPKRKMILPVRIQLTRLKKITAQNYHLYS